MTEQEARKRAEEKAREYAMEVWGDPFLKTNENGEEYGTDEVSEDWQSCYDHYVMAYMQCYRDMCGGKPDYYVAMWKGVPQNALAGVEHDDVDALCAERGIETTGHLTDWEIVPVKLLRMA